ncbi:ASCH domain-containing protein [Ammoniphilus sp. CFH 90114]|uniref:ASCH domain-containing protein n=1 Tax=Ammoniphilus sp. CFH 90114 TaxID=2493665 RepID=UPI00196AE89F|nr:ASCH domain-containing protein [Ammoniphilus sp. CFH 90114]
MKPEHESVRAMWRDFLRKKGVPSEKGYASWHFELTEESANKLAYLVKNGQKKATAAALWSFEQNNEPLPQVGDYSVITDWHGIAPSKRQRSKSFLFATLQRNTLGLKEKAI